jgi:ribosomal protein L10
MAVSKQKKSEIFSELVAKFKEAKSLGFVSTNKMTVEEFSDLRKSLREVGATYTLAKKTIIVKAVKEALNLDIDLATLDGQI